MTDAPDMEPAEAAIIFRGLRYRLVPTGQQTQLLRQCVGVCRLIYNLALEQRTTWWRQYHQQTGRHFNYFSQTKELPALRAQYDWIGSVASAPQQSALRDLDIAFSNFFAGRAKYPTPRKRGVNDAFRIPYRDLKLKTLNRKWSAVHLPKIGWVKFRDTRPLQGEIRNATVTLDALGWHVSFACEIAHKTPSNYSPAVGIDRGVINTLALSTGELISIPAAIEDIERRRRVAQRAASRGKRGSLRHAKAMRRVARLSARVARARRDWQHRTSLDIAKRFGAVAIEDLDVKKMTASARGTIEEPGRGVRQKAGLNRNILSQGWTCFETILAYKLTERGGQLIKVDPAYTSQTCSDCGTVDSESRESQASFSCRHCGFRAHADHNAAINILRRSTASMRMEEGARPSDEVRTGDGGLPVENLLAFCQAEDVNRTGSGIEK